MNNLKSESLVFFDLETTGTNPSKDRIVQFAFVKGKEKYTTRVNPLIHIPEEASEVHGIYDDDVKNFNELWYWADTIADILSECILCGYNIRNFDVPLLVNDLKRAVPGREWDWIYKLPIIDTYILYMQYRPRTLEAAYADIVGGEFDAHDAMADVIATIEITDELAGLYNASEEDLVKKSTPEGFCDFSGKLIEKDGEILFNFGKHKGERVHDNRDYAMWMLSTDFPEDTKDILRKTINK